MKANTHMFWILAAFFFAISALYTVWSLVDAHHGYVEWVGTLALALCGALFSLIAFFLGSAHHAQGGELPEDIATSDIDDGDSEVGFYSPWSWWPLMVAAGAAVVFLGIAIGAWIAYIGVVLSLVSIVGWTYEYYRGYFGR